MNTGFYKDLDTNFEQAYVLCTQKYTHVELLEFLKQGNIPQKQMAALKFDKVENEEDAKALLQNLTGCDGKIREAVAMKIFQLITADNSACKYFADLGANVFADATIDINANICRLIVDSARILKSYENFTQIYTSKIVSYIQEALQELDKFIFRDKKYVINKQLFKLYWSLEALKYFYENVDEQILLRIIAKASEQKEYTIREKAAEIVVRSEKLIAFREKLQNDENYYVSSVFLNH